MRVNEVVGVAGFVVPGTRVDVVVTFEARSRNSEGLARVVVSNVQVLTAGTRYDQEKARQDARPIPTSVVTLLVSPEDAERVALAGAWEPSRSRCAIRSIRRPPRPPAFGWRG